MAKKPSSDEVGLKMLEQLIEQGGRKRMTSLLAPEEGETDAEEAKSDELNLDELEALATRKG